MKLRPEEITSILRSRIEQYDVETDLAEVGTVLQVGDGIARIYGLENAVAMEMLELEHGVVGLAFNLEEDDVGAALFGEWEQVSEGDPPPRVQGAGRDRAPAGQGADADRHQGDRRDDERRPGAAGADHRRPL